MRCAHCCCLIMQNYPACHAVVGSDSNSLHLCLLRLLAKKSAATVLIGVSLLQIQRRTVLSRPAAAVGAAAASAGLVNVRCSSQYAVFMEHLLSLCARAELLAFHTCCRCFSAVQTAACWHSCSGVGFTPCCRTHLAKAPMPSALIRSLSKPSPVAKIEATAAQKCVSNPNYHQDTLC
jgi:hypothetical protein